jgi:hydrogenase/urease accessory protein HupE
MKESVLYDFCAQRCADGNMPQTALIADVNDAPEAQRLRTEFEARRASATVNNALAVNAGVDRRHLFKDYVVHGIMHILTGYDHLLFITALVLGAATFGDLIKVVTAFTLAHSITLSLAALGIVSLPSRWVESAIALSVVLAALNNLFPVVASGRWIAAFGFGLLHGFGFASALSDLGLPTGALALSLAGFNVGVELGQLAIVAVFLPLAFVLRGTWTYRRVILAGGSAAIAAIAGVWLVERAFDVPLFAMLVAQRWVDASRFVGST